MAASNTRVVIIGAGHNGLVTAAYLAKAMGFAPPFSNAARRSVYMVANEEIHTGFGVLHSHTP